MGVGSWEKVPDGERKLFLRKSAFRSIARLPHAAQGQAPLNTKVVRILGGREPKILNKRKKDPEPIKRELCLL